jgi:hypothetical protein
MFLYIFSVLIWGLFFIYYATASLFYELPDLIILNNELTLLFLIAALHADTTCVLYLPTENRSRNNSKKMVNRHINT